MELSLNLTNSKNLIIHWSMNCGQFKDLLCYLCLPGSERACWSLTQEIANLNTLMFSQNISQNSTEFI